jgi:bifunctional ADP-heptose synthase (sugar kinase/adenylyltransferase)
VTGEPEAKSGFLESFKARHSTGAVLAALASLRGLKALVIGEAMIDEYNYCTPAGRAPKDPIISTKHVRLERQLGGALACANHVAGFCDEVHVVTCLGDEKLQEKFVRERLRPNVAARFFVRHGAPTVTKRRYVWEARLIKLFEVVISDDTPLPNGIEEMMLADLDATLSDYDVVITADYGHGLLGPRLVTLLTERARFLAVSTQANPGNFGFNVITKYPRADYVCLDELEARLALRDRWSPLPRLVHAIRADLHCSTISVTRGHEGVVASGPDERQWEVPALTRDVVDRMGAGDAYFAVTAPCVAAGMPMDVATLLGGAAAAMAVGIIGNRASLDAAAVQRFVTAVLD